MTLRVVVPVALICGLLAAFASSARAVPPVPRCPAPAAVKPPSQAVFDAFGVLRRERTDADTLSAKALRTLRLRGIRLADPQSARLLRQTATGGRAWVVPVADLRPLLGGLTVVCAAPRRQVERRPRAPRARAPRRSRPPRTMPAPRPVPRRLPAPVLATPYAPVPFGVEPFPSYPPAMRLDKPQEGLIVVAEGDAPVGGGGIHKQLIRGLAAPAVAPCAGPKRDLVSVSGIVPDGVGTAFLTSTDGTAIKTEIKDNAYTFVVPAAKRRELFAPRYVVWVGGDGTPHVQPVALGRLPARLCAALSRRGDPFGRITPAGGFEPAPALFGLQRAPGPILAAPVPVPSRAPTPARPRRP